MRVTRHRRWTSLRNGQGLQPKRQFLAVIGSAALLIAVVSSQATDSNAQTATFDFDTGTPSLLLGQNVPFDQTSGGVTAHFSSPTVGAGGFSVQSDASTHFSLSKFSAQYLYPNSISNPALDIQFSQPLSRITLAFATADFQQVEIPTTIKLTAYEDSTGTPAVGSATAHGTYAADTMPMGTLSFTSARPFNLVEVTIPFAPMAASGFLADNITVNTTTLAPTDTPTSAATPIPTPTVSPSSCVGDCGSDQAVTVDELLTMVNIALGNGQLSACIAGDGNQDGAITVDEILAAVSNALNGCSVVAPHPLSRSHGRGRSWAYGTR